MNAPTGNIAGPSTATAGHAAPFPPGYGTPTPLSAGMPPPPPPGPTLYSQQLAMPNAVSPSQALYPPSSADVPPRSHILYSQWHAMMNAAASYSAPTTPTSADLTPSAAGFLRHRFPALMTRPSESRPPRSLSIAPVLGRAPDLNVAAGQGEAQATWPSPSSTLTVPSGSAPISARSSRALAEVYQHFVHQQRHLLAEDEAEGGGHQGRS